MTGAAERDRSDRILTIESRIQRGVSKSHARLSTGGSSWVRILLSLCLRAAVGFGVGGCPPTDMTGTGAAAIRGGTADSAHPAVVFMLVRRWAPGSPVPGPSGFCSAVLVSPRVLLTAAHCVVGSPGGEIDIERGFSPISLFGDPQDLVAVATRQPTEGDATREKGASRFLPGRLRFPIHPYLCKPAGVG